MSAERRRAPAGAECSLTDCVQPAAYSITIYRGAMRTPDWVGVCVSCSQRPEVLAAMAPPPPAIRLVLTQPAEPAHNQEPTMPITLPPVRDNILPGTCRLEGCSSPSKTRGLCRSHFNAAYRARRTDELGAPSMHHTQVARPVVAAVDTSLPPPVVVDVEVSMPETPATIPAEPSELATTATTTPAEGAAPEAATEPLAGNLWPEDAWSEDDLDDFAWVTVTAKGRAALAETPPTLEHLEAELLARLQAVSELKRLPEEIRDGDEVIVLLGLDGRWELAQHPSLNRKLRAVVNLALHSYRIDLERTAFGSAR